MRGVMRFLKDIRRRDHLFILICKARKKARDHCNTFMFLLKQRRLNEEQIIYFCNVSSAIRSLCDDIIPCFYFLLPLSVIRQVQRSGRTYSCFTLT